MSEIDILRKQIDEIDDELLDLLQKRFDICEQIGLLKQKSNFNVEDTNREKEIVLRLENKSKKPLNQLIAPLYKQIFSFSKELQKADK